MSDTGPLNRMLDLLPPERRIAVLDHISPNEAAALEQDGLTVTAGLGPRRDQIVLKAFRPTVPDERYQIPPDGDWRVWLFLGGRGCVAGWTRVWTPDGWRRIDDLAAAAVPTDVMALTPDGPQVIRTDGAPFRKGTAQLHTFILSDGRRITVTDRHRFLTHDGWVTAGNVRVGHQIASHDDAPTVRDAGAHRSTRTPAGSLAGCRPGCRCGDGRPRPDEAAGRSSVQRPADAHAQSHATTRQDAQASTAGRTRACRCDGHRSTPGCPALGMQSLDGRCPTGPSDGAQSRPTHQADDPSRRSSHPLTPMLRSGHDAASGRGSSLLTVHPDVPGSSCDHASGFRGPAAVGRPSATTSRTALLDRSTTVHQGTAEPPASSLHPCRYLRVTAIIDVGVHPFYDMTVPGAANYLAEGIWNHNTGKTQSVAVRFYDHMMGPPCIPGIPGGHLGAIIGPTLGDVSTSAVNGASGLKTLDSRVREVTRKGGTIVAFPNGAIAKEFGAHTAADVERLRSGGNTCCVWAEELAAWTAIGYDNDAWDLMQTGLRLGPRPQVFASTTPKPKKLIRELVKRAKAGDRRTVVTGGTMYDNVDNLAPDFIDEMETLYKGTRVEAQELLGLLLDHVEGALWTPDAIDVDRIGVDQVPPLVRVTVGVDPAFSDEDAADEAGIICVGIGIPPGTRRPHAYVLEDQSCRGGFVWPGRAVERWRHFHDDAARGAKTVTEANLGGKNFLTKMLKAVDSSVVVDMVHAAVGKRTRAEPVALLYDKHVVHHVGTLALLEQEMTTWVPGDKSPNRLDALVWALEDVRQQLVGAPAKVGAARNSGTVMPSRTGAA